MTTHEIDGARGDASQWMAKLKAAGVAASCSGIAYLIGGWSFASAAEQAQIRDLRAAQVTSYFGTLLLLACSVMVLAMLIHWGRSDNPSSTSPRRIIAMATGILLGTTLASVAVVLVASLGTVVVTPPRAWILVTASACFGAVACLQALRGRKTSGRP